VAKIRYLVVYGAGGVELGQGNVPGEELYDHGGKLVRAGEISPLVCFPKSAPQGPYCRIRANGLFVESETSPAKCRQCSIGATGYLQCKWVTC
jgi:hypothetical protein